MSDRGHDEFEAQQDQTTRCTQAFFTIHAERHQFSMEWLDDVVKRLEQDSWVDWHGPVGAGFRSGLRYGAMAREIGESGNEHYQVVFILPKGKTASFAQWRSMAAAAFNIELPKVWMMKCKNTNAAIKYCTGFHRESATSRKWIEKPGVQEVREIGEYDAQSGKRTDLEDTRDILEREVIGKQRRLEAVAMDAPQMFASFCKYSGALTKLAEHSALERVRTTMPDAYWWFGRSGHGKSYGAREMAVKYITSKHPGISEEAAKQRIYYKPAGDWYTGYNNQFHDVIIMEEVRDCKSRHMREFCELVGDSPYNVNRKSLVEMPVLAGQIHVTSPNDPTEAFTGLNVHDSIEQIGRRFAFYHATMSMEEDGTRKYEYTQQWYDHEQLAMSTVYPVGTVARYPPALESIAEEEV